MPAFTPKQNRALSAHAERLDKAADRAESHYESLRANWGYFASDTRGLLSIAAHAADSARASSRDFRQALDAATTSD